jgi:hypothetical protein
MWVEKKYEESKLMIAKNLAHISVGFAAIFAVNSALAVNNTSTPAPAIANYARPLSFEPNRGQADKHFDFLAHAAGYRLFLSRGEAAILLQRHGPPRLNSAGTTALRMRMIGADPTTAPNPLEQQPSTSNYFIGSVAEKWHANIANYAKVRYRNVYPGVDLIYYGNQRQLEYDFIITPGADPRRILLDFAGATKVNLDGDSSFVIHTSAGDLRWRKPVAYQEINGGRRFVACAYARRDEHGLEFKLGAYDRTKPLIIDPVLEYSTYLGGSDSQANEFGASSSSNGIAVDGKGNTYITGWTTCVDFPIKNAFQDVAPGSSFIPNAFIAKFDTNGNLVYSTYLGGNVSLFDFPSGDFGNGIAVDAQGNAYVAGETFSLDFPTKNAFQASLKAASDIHPENAFVTKLDATGSALIYSTYLGGSVADVGTAIAVDAHASAYVTGVTESPDFSIKNAFQNHLRGVANAFITKFDTAGNSLVYSSFIGGRDTDIGRAIALDASDNAYITGTTGSSDFPTRNAFQETLKGQHDAFVSKIDSAGCALIYSSYLGGSGDDMGQGIAVDTHSNAYVTGETGSLNFPIKNALQHKLKSANGNAFVTKFDPAGSKLVYSTYLGGTGGDIGYAIAVDCYGDAYIAGGTNSKDFPVKDAFQHKLKGSSGNAFIAKLDAAGCALIYSSYLGGSFEDIAYGISVDKCHNAYVTGTTYSSDFPTTTNAFQNSLAGERDAFLTKISAK